MAWRGGTAGGEDGCFLSHHAKAVPRPSVRACTVACIGDYRQVINIAAPPVEDLGSSRISREMARVGNESLAELVARHPGRMLRYGLVKTKPDVRTAVYLPNG